MPKWWNYLHTFVFYTGVILIGYALVRIYYARWSAPEGVCPTYTFQNIINIGIVFAALYFIMSLIEWIYNKWLIHSANDGAK